MEAAWTVAAGASPEIPCSELASIVETSSRLTPYFIGRSRGIGADHDPQWLWLVFLVGASRKIRKRGVALVLELLVNADG
jgi:hypothetical protein